MKLFRSDNTEGYTDAQLGALNAEWEMRADRLGLKEGTEEYDLCAKSFCDEVGRRAYGGGVK